MSHKHFDDNCNGCRPVIADPETMERLPDTHPVVQAMDRVWAATTREEREAFHNVTCLNSRTPEDLSVMQRIIQQVQQLADKSK